MCRLAGSLKHWTTLPTRQVPPPTGRMPDSDIALRRRSVHHSQKSQNGLRAVQFFERRRLFIVFSTQKDAEWQKSQITCNRRAHLPPKNTFIAVTRHLQNSWRPLRAASACSHRGEQSFAALEDRPH